MKCRSGWDGGMKNQVVRCHEPSGDEASEWARFTAQMARIGRPAVEFRYWERGGRLWCGGERAKSPSAVDWIFGSGRHGQTAVTVRTNDRGEALALEHHASAHSASV